MPRSLRSSRRLPAADDGWKPVSKVADLLGGARVPDGVLPDGTEDQERAKLEGLAAALGWRLARDDQREWIEGEVERRTTRIVVERVPLWHDVIRVERDTPSRLVARVVREGAGSRGAQWLASRLSALLPVYADIKTGDREIDQNLFFEVAADHKPRLEALVALGETRSLLKRVFSRFDGLALDEHGLTLTKRIRPGDLDEARVREDIAWVVAIDRLDGIYLDG